MIGSSAFEIYIFAFTRVPSKNCFHVALSSLSQNVSSRAPHSSGRLSITTIPFTFFGIAHSTQPTDTEALVRAILSDCVWAFAILAEAKIKAVKEEANFIYLKLRFNYFIWRGALSWYLNLNKTLYSPSESITLRLSRSHYSNNRTYLFIVFFYTFFCFYRLSFSYSCGGCIT